MIWPAGGGVVAKSDDEKGPAWMGLSRDSDGVLAMVVAHGGEAWEWTFTEEDADSLIGVIRNDQPV